ncbi:MAG: 50S ribosomal protein L31 [Alphaproteobacteria bacterium CG_4_9_14_3_um_filter_47_13]|nr:MAG: 50S ribosomal protein L31 [Alphaproteobacteria bacterium CG_4_9_14_3_um_filter_47_13]
MKAETHPDYHEITVVLTDGTEYKTRSTYGKEGDVMKLDIDCLSHPAWSGGAQKVIEKGQLSKFENRYGSLFGGGENTTKKEEATK